PQAVTKPMTSDSDGRRQLPHLTAEGQKAFAVLDQRSRDEVAEVLADLDMDTQQRLLKEMHTIQSIIDKGFKFSEPFVLRQNEPGDMGWVTHRHGVLYAQEYGWNQEFEALVAEIVAGFIKNYNPARERCWIAEMGGEI